MSYPGAFCGYLAHLLSRGLQLVLGCDKLSGLLLTPGSKCLAQQRCHRLVEVSIEHCAALRLHHEVLHVLHGANV